METTKSVISYLNEKGFGFIKSPVAGQKDIFFHASSLKTDLFEDLKKGDKVEYSDLIVDEKGTCAKLVKVILD